MILSEFKLKRSSNGMSVERELHVIKVTGNVVGGSVEDSFVKLEPIKDSVEVEQVDLPPVVSLKDEDLSWTGLSADEWT